MNIRYAILVLSLALVVAVGASAQQNELNWTMERVVKQLDRQGSDLESVLADVEIEWTGKDEALAEIKTGRIYFNEKGEFRINVATPSSMTILPERGTVHHYKPDANLGEQYSLSGGEVLTVTYRGTARNLELNPKLFDDSWPRGTDKKRM